jgi:NAD(P)H-dependent flavin oxidoreductase YrpB (nitropropane dioxygenase family)
VHTVEQARRVAQLGVDAIIAQGSEAGGQGMALGVGAMALIPQVVDAVAPIPVLAAGGVADGGGLAATMVLGAQGANVGTRFLAPEEASADDAWKRAILETKSEDVVRFEVWAEIFPSTSDRAYETVPRVMRTSFIEEWQGSEEGGGAATVGDQVGNPAAQTARARALPQSDGGLDPRRVARRRDPARHGCRGGASPGASKRTARLYLTQTSENTLFGTGVNTLPRDPLPKISLGRGRPRTNNTD